MGTAAFRGYLLLIGFVLLIVGIVVAASSVGMLSDYWALSDASLQLLIGGFVAIAGGLLLLVGFLSP